MTYQYWLHEKVQEDIDDAYSWYENKLKGLGLEFLNSIEKKLADITAHPETFSSKGNTNYREALSDRFPFVIVYKIYKHKRTIFISTIHHAKKSVRKKYRKP